MASLLTKRSSFSLPLVPWAMSVIEGGQENRTRLGGFARGLGAGSLGLLGLQLGKSVDEILSENSLKESYIGRILGTVAGGLGGYKLGDLLLKYHNASKENENALKEYEEAKKEDEQLSKKAATIGALIGALHPEMSTVGGAVRGGGIEGGSFIGGGAGALLGGLLGAHIGNWFYNDTDAGLKIGTLLGGIPGAIIGGRLGWKASKKLLQEHAMTPEENEDRNALP